MNDPEGVIKYNLIHTCQPLNDAATVADIDAWRSVIYRLGLIGRNPERYGGLGFGNISSRAPDDSADFFIISGSQTGHLKQLDADHYCAIETADLTDNTIRSRGLCKPSSEALTHACVYQQSRRIRAVIHAHCPEIWNHADALNLPQTDAKAAYGTPAMVAAVKAIFDSGVLGLKGTFSMLGHEDGIVAFGRSLEQAAWELIRQFAQALRVVQDRNYD